jgi:hypothetical protein
MKHFSPDQEWAINARKMRRDVFLGKLRQKFETPRWCAHHLGDHEKVWAAPGSPLCRGCEQDYQLFGHFELYKFPAAVERAVRPEILEGIADESFRTASEQYKAERGVGTFARFRELRMKDLRHAMWVAGRRVDQAARAIGVRRI